jgi:hypothetical protein
LQKALGGSLFDDLTGDLLDKGFPVGWWNMRLICDFLADGILASS